MSIATVIASTSVSATALLDFTAPLRHGNEGSLPRDAAVLRCVDDLRRDLSLQLNGDAGCFAGFDRLDVDLPTSGEPLVLTVSATASRLASGGMSLRFEASRRLPDGTSGVCVARGHGVVVLPTSARGRQAEP